MSQERDARRKKGLPIRTLEDLTQSENFDAQLTKLEEEEAAKAAAIAPPPGPEVVISVKG